MNLFTLADPKAFTYRNYDQPIVTLTKVEQCWADLHPSAPSVEDTYRTDKSNSISRNATQSGKGVNELWL